MFLHVRIYYFYQTIQQQRIQSTMKHQLLSPIRQWSVILMLFGNLFARRKMKNGNCCASVFCSKIMTIIIFLLAAMSVAVVIVAGYITTGTHAFTTFAKLPPRVSVLASSSLSYARQSTILYSQSSIPIPSTPTPNDNLSKKQMKQWYDDEN